MNIITIYMPENEWDIDLLEMALKQKPDQIFVYFPDGTNEVITRN